MEDFIYPSYSMIQGKVFGKDARKDGVSIIETRLRAAKHCGLSDLPKDPAHLVHGAENGWFST